MVQVQLGVMLGASGEIRQGGWSPPVRRDFARNENRADKHCSGWLKKERVSTPRSEAKNPPHPRGAIATGGCAGI